jgi:hypothetical protein
MSVATNFQKEKEMNRCISISHVASAALAIVMSLLTQALPAYCAEPDNRTTNNKFLLKEEPKDAADVLAVRKNAKDQEEVVVVGRVGGRVNPWVKGSAVFSIVDRSLKPCNEIPGDTCETPWDYCCATDLPKATLMVMVMDEQGKILKKDARELLGVKELDTVVIRGTAKRDKAGNVSILASKMFVSPDTNNRKEPKP